MTKFIFMSEEVQYLIRMLISKDTSGLLSIELVSWVVNTGLDALVKSYTVGGNFVPVLLVDLKINRRLIGVPEAIFLDIVLIIHNERRKMAKSFAWNYNGLENMTIFVVDDRAPKNPKN